MKMKKIFTCLAMLLCTGYAMADDQMTIADVTIPQGGSEELVVKYSVEGERVGFAFALDLPEGIELAMNGTKPVMVKYPCISGLDVSFVRGKDEAGAPTSTHSFGAMPSSDVAVITGTDGTLLMLTINASASMTPGEYTVPVTKALFNYRDAGSVKDNLIADFNIKVTVVSSDRVVLRETSPVAPEPANGVNVTVKRTFKAGKWSTFCLPFRIPKETVVEIFGDDAKFATFKNYEVIKDGSTISEIKVNFDEHDYKNKNFIANRPYLVKTSTDISEFDVDNVTISIGSPQTQYTDTDEDDETVVLGTFYGNYVAGTIVPQNSLFISDNKFWYSTGASMMLAFRGYFTFNDRYAPSTARVTFNVDGETTDISDAMFQGAGDAADEVYDLQGRRVNNPGKGIYIKNGKKIFVK